MKSKSWTGSKPFFGNGCISIRSFYSAPEPGEEAEPYSDLDVLVIIDGVTDEAVRDWVSDCAWEAAYAQGLVIVPLVFSRTE